MASSASDIKRTYKMDKLTGSNYKIWSIKMEMLLVRAELWDYVNGSSLAPVPPAPVAPVVAGGLPTQIDPALKAWRSSDSKARADIILHCGDAQIQLIHSLPTSKEMWDKLKATYDHVDIGTQVHSHRKLTNMKLLDSQSVPEFLDQWQAAVDDTTSAGLNIPSTQLVMMLLSALPSSWRSFVTTQCGVVNLTLQQSLIGKILQEDIMRNPTNETDSSQLVSNQTALFTATRKFDRRNRRPVMRSYNNRQFNTA